MKRFATLCTLLFGLFLSSAVQAQCGGEGQYTCFGFCNASLAPDPATAYLTFTACGGPSPAPVRVARLAYQHEMVSLDPHGQNDAVTGTILSAVYEPLVNVSSTAGAIPCLAVEWSRPDPTTWRLRLRDGVLFHDGRPLLVDDVIAFEDVLIDFVCVHSNFLFCCAISSGQGARKFLTTPSGSKAFRIILLRFLFRECGELKISLQVQVTFLHDET